ncbi:MAG: hypothetical protein ABIR96_03605 [Bdellovibrionota bacterium]
MKNFQWTRSSLILGAFTALSLYATEKDHDGVTSAPQQQNGVKSSASKEFMALERDASGSLVRTMGEMNRNGVRETFVNWDEGASNAGLIGQVTWDYSPFRPSAGMPTNPQDLVQPTKRRISEAFANFLNKNMKFCIAAASMPAMQLHVTKAMAAIKKEYGSDYKTQSGSHGLVIDMEMKKSVGDFFSKNADAINKEVQNIAQVKLLHQGIAGDESHHDTSYHAADAMRAIDMSHLLVVKKTKNAKGETVTSTKLWQHNVSSYAERAVDSGQGDSLSDEQMGQHAFWQAYGACLQQKGGAIISYDSQHTGAGMKHQGHMHVSLPYDPPGSYNEK